MLIGVRRLREKFYLDNDTSLYTPLQVYKSDLEKQYANGDFYNDTVAFAFGYNPTKKWVGQCLYLKYDTGMGPRDNKYCDHEAGYMCKWVPPNCPSPYVHGGHAYDSRTCIAVLPSAVGPSQTSCDAPAVDEVRRLAAPTSFQATERLSYLVTSDSGGWLRPTYEGINNTWIWWDDETKPFTNVQTAMVDTRLPLPWNASRFGTNETGCARMWGNGIFDVRVDNVNESCSDVTANPVCEYESK